MAKCVCLVSTFHRARVLVYSREPPYSPLSSLYTVLVLVQEVPERRRGSAGSCARRCQRHQADPRNGLHGATLVYQHLFLCSRTHELPSFRPAVSASSSTSASWSTRHSCASRSPRSTQSVRQRRRLHVRKSGDQVLVLRSPPRHRHSTSLQQYACTSPLSLITHIFAVLQYGFSLPAEWIRPVGEETANMVRFLAGFIAKKLKCEWSCRYAPQHHTREADPLLPTWIDRVTSFTPASVYPPVLSSRCLVSLARSVTIYALAPCMNTQTNLPALDRAP